ncbi:MAG: response regulator [Nitrospinae bacterium]|nr:response regulator [Nitrospinota bacterium]
MAEEVICPECKKPSYTASHHEPPPCQYCGFVFYKEERKMKRTILAIDDDTSILALIVNILTVYGYEVKTAANGLEGLKMIESAQYDLIISDINMPVMDGIEFYRELVNMTPSMKGRVIFVTGDMEPTTEKFIQETGARWFSKPLNIAEFLRAINDSGK